jgi:hypothetical protein
MLHRLAESIPGLLKRLQIRALRIRFNGLCERTLTSFLILSLSSTFLFTSFLTNGSNIAFCVGGGVYVFESGNLSEPQ